MKNATNKARADVERILEKKGFAPIDLNIPYPSTGNPIKVIQSQMTTHKRWKQALLSLSKGDLLFLQLPVKSHSIFHANLIRNFSRRGIHSIVLIHDLDKLRIGNEAKLKKRLRIEFEDIRLLKAADAVISHNQRMTDALISFGISKENIIELELFDYLVSDPSMLNHNKARARTSIVIAGNLSQNKVGYINELSKFPDLTFELYGVGYSSTGAENIHYYGSFMPDELPSYL